MNRKYINLCIYMKVFVQIKRIKKQTSAYIDTYLNVTEAIYPKLGESTILLHY